MRSRIVLLVVICLVLSACNPSLGLPSPVPRERPTVAATHADAAPVPGGFASVPLAVGRGFDGGWFQLYFTDPHDPASEQQDGGPDLAVVSAIDSAQLSIDAALYSLTLRGVREALVRAHRRGVVVRIVMESDNMDGAEPQALKDAGIPLVGDRGEGLMHNKFVVIDRSEVWTGSMNLTRDGTYADRNNLFRIHSSEVAADYVAEFEEMFTDDRFGNKRGRTTPHPHVDIDGVPMDIYFSPDDHVQSALLALLQQTSKSIDFLAYSFTSDPLSEGIRERAGAGIAVRGVMDADQMKFNMGSEYDRFRAAGLDVRLDAESGLMHHKVMILDGQIVVLGSYNFTASAEKYNDENVLVIHSAQIAALYEQEFRRIYRLAGP